MALVRRGVPLGTHEVVRHARGAVVADDGAAADEARALERALDTAIPESVYEEMEKEMANGG